MTQGMMRRLGAGRPQIAWPVQPVPRKLPLASATLCAMSLLVLAVFIIGGHVSSMIPRWTQSEDLGDTIGYVAAWTGLYGGLLIFRARRIALAGCVVTWFVVLFGIGPVAAVGTLALVAFLLGDAALWAGAFSEATVSGTPLRIAAGFGCLMALSLALVLLGVANATVECIALAAVLGSRHRVAFAAARRLLSWSSGRLAPDPLHGLAAIPLLLMLVYAVYASFQESHSDALVMHLLIPHQVQLTGTWSFDASLFTRFAVIPKGASWLFTLAYLLAGEGGARLLNLAFTLVTSWIVHDAVRARVDGKSAAVACGVFLSAPLTFWCVSVLFEDAIYTLYLTSAVLVLAALWERPSPRRAALVSLFLSAAMATKAQGLPASLPVLLLLGLRLAWTLPLRLVLRSALFMAVPALLIGAVPYTIALVKTGNPLFPYYNAFFRSPLFASIDFIDDRWTHHGSWRMLWDMTFHSSRFVEGMDGVFGFDVLATFPALVVALLLGPQVAFTVPLAAAVGIFLIQMDLIQYARYVYCTFPMLGIAMGGLWRRMTDEGTRPVLTAALLMLIGLNVFSGRSINYFYRFYPPLPWSAARSQPAYPAERRFNTTVNALMGRNARVLYLARDFGAGLDGTALLDWEFDDYALYRASLAIKDLEGLKAFLKAYRVDYIQTDGDIGGPAAQVMLPLLPQVAEIVQEIGTARLWRVDGAGR